MATTRPTSPDRPYHHGDLRRAIMSAALEAIAAEGPAALSLRDLARRAGQLQVRERATLTVHGWKAHANDLVSDVDLASEGLIADGLRDTLDPPTRRRRA